MNGHHEKSNALAQKAHIIRSGLDPCGSISPCVQSLVFLSWLVLKVIVYHNWNSGTTTFENFMYYWMPPPVASLKQLLVSFLQNWKTPRPSCCVPDFCCHSCLRHWAVSLNVG